MKLVKRRMRQIAMRVGGFVVDAGFEAIVLELEISQVNSRAGWKVVSNWSSSSRLDKVVPVQSSMYLPRSFGVGPSNWSQICSSV